jgi:hypothetical protein
MPHSRCGQVGEDGAFNELLLAALERLRPALQHFAPERRQKLHREIDGNRGSKWDDW